MVSVVLDNSCVSEDESELDDVDAEELGLESIDARESMGVAGRGAVVCGPLRVVRGPTLSGWLGAVKDERREGLS